MTSVPWLAAPSANACDERTDDSRMSCAITICGALVKTVNAAPTALRGVGVEFVRNNAANVVRLHDLRKVAHSPSLGLVAPSMRAYAA